MLKSCLRYALLCVSTCITSHALPPTGSACGGQSYTKDLSIERSSDFQTVKATMRVGSISPPNPCSFWAYAKLTSPNGSRNAEGEDYPNHQYHPYQAKAEAVLGMGTEDGTYSALGNYRVEDDTQPPPTILFYPADGDGTLNKSAYVRGFVQLTSTDWSPSTTGSTGSSSFNVHLYASDHCDGSVTVSGALVSVPAGLNYYWHNVWNPASTTSIVGYTWPAQQSQVSFYLNLYGGNTGQVKARGSLLEVPANCDIRGPITPGSVEATLTVN